MTQVLRRFLRRFRFDQDAAGPGQQGKDNRDHQHLVVSTLHDFTTKGTKDVSTSHRQDGVGIEDRHVDARTKIIHHRRTGPGVTGEQFRKPRSDLLPYRILYIHRKLQDRCGLDDRNRKGRVVILMSQYFSESVVNRIIDQRQDERRQLQLVGADFIQTNRDRIEKPPPISGIVFHIAAVGFGFLRRHLFQGNVGQRPHPRQGTVPLAADQTRGVQCDVFALPALRQVFAVDQIWQRVRLGMPVQASQHGAGRQGFHLRLGHHPPSLSNFHLGSHQPPHERVGEVGIQARLVADT